MEFFRMHTHDKPLTADSPLMSIITKCLDKKAGFRYGDYDDLLNDLKTLAKRLNIIIPSQVHVLKEDEALFAKAQSYVALGDSNKALAFIDEYTMSYPENACGWTEKGRLHYDRGEYPQGLAATKQSLKINPYNTHAWNNLGILLSRTEAPIAEVKLAYTKALHFDPYNTAAMMNLVGPLVQHKEYAEAVELTGRAIRLQPAKPLILHNAKALLTELFDARQFAATETLLSGWTEAWPTDTVAWEKLGLISLDKGMLERAIQCFKQIHELSPQDNFAVLQLAKLCFRTKKGRECLDYCNKLLQRGYEPFLAVDLKARVLNFFGGYEQALNFLQPYLDQNPENDALWVVLSEIHEHRDNYDSAIEALQRAKCLLERSTSEHKADNLKIVDLKLQQLSSMK
jgi:tetratricopeptide (TPR) repeat protein